MLLLGIDHKDQVDLKLEAFQHEHFTNIPDRLCGSSHWGTISQVDLVVSAVT